MKRLLVRLVLALSLACTPTLALAVAVYDAQVNLFVSAPFAIPAGTGIVLNQGTAGGFPGIVGGGVADFEADANVPGAVFVSASGSAAAPPDSVAVSSATATSSGSLLNTNTAPVVFPILIGGSWSVFASAGAFEAAEAAISFSVLFDGQPLVQHQQQIAFAPGAGALGDVIGGPFNLPLTPGVLHSLSISAQAEGQAVATAPEPSTLLLAVAGVVMVACRRRQRRNA